MNSIYLVLAHMRFHWQRSMLLLGCLTISLLLPILIPQLVSRIQQELHQRSESIPLVVGSNKCSPLDLTLHGLYFRSEDVPTIPYGKWNQIAERYPAFVAPLHVRFHISDQNNRSFPIVGTSLEYFSLQGLTLESGEQFAMLGDCVIGFNVARKMKLSVGDHVVSAPKSIVSLAAAYPVQLNVVGILEKTDSVEDDAVLTDIKTAWVLENLGHGHQDVSNSNDPNLVLERSESNTVASAAVVPYTVIDEDNLDSFHFHGETSSFPITGVLVITQDSRSLDLIAGLAARDSEIQAVDARSEVDRLLSVVFQIQWLLLAVIVIIALATLLLFSLVVGLSVQIRKSEMETMYKLGGSRWLTLQLHAGEVICIFAIAATLAWTIAQIIQSLLSSQWLHSML